MSTSLDEILEDPKLPVEAKEEPEQVEPAPETPETVEEPKAEEVEKPEVEEPGAEEPKVEEPVEEPEKTVPIAALHETREQLKAVRRQNEELTGLFKKLEPHLQKPEQPEPEKDFYADPKGYVENLVSQVQTQTQQTQARAYLNLSEAQARARHEDYEPVVQEFADLAKQNPELKSEMLRQVDPGEWAYQFAKRAKAINELGDPATARERLETELRDKLRAEWEEEARTAAENQEPEKTVPSLPKSLAGTRNAGARKGPAWSGPTPMDEILNPG